ncbi:MAG TPA: OsmC family protein [Acidimicrobiales bacterium]|nr:OsmC family protein [Acidimicrobiales bacterium]
MTTYRYELTARWTGNLGEGTSAYHAYGRNFEIIGNGKPVLLGSADSSFRGDSSKYNPEELLLAALSGCHLLWYLNLCADAGVVVISYEDHPRGTMILGKDGRGAFSEALLCPKVCVKSEDMKPLAADLHEKANELCFIARSVNFPVRHDSKIVSKADWDS